MKTHDDLIQGSNEWLAFRAAHFPASEAPSMMGESPYKTRTQLLNEKHTGLVPDVDAATQRRFDDGHRFESLARPLAEEIIGEPLSPVTGSDGMLSASFDGLTFMGDIVLEHKSLNEEIRAAKSAADLGPHYRIQMEQQLAVSGAEKCLFMATKWNSDDELQEQVFHWYTPDMELRAKIIAGWEQFAKDLAAYSPREIAEKPKAEVVIELPALFVHAKGEITEHNMEAFGLALTTKLAEVRAIALVNDQDFSNAKEAAKKFRETAKAIALSKEAMLSQTETIGEAARKMDAWAKDLNATALQLEKDVEREDLAKKRAMIDAARIEFAEHVEALEVETKPIKLSAQRPDFAEAIKGKRNYASMHDAIGGYLANGKIAADKEANETRHKLAFLAGTGKYLFLFHDLQHVISKPIEDFEMLVNARIEKHKQAEAEQLEAERKRIQADEEAKAHAKVKAEQEAKAAQERENQRIADSAEQARLAESARKMAVENAEAIKVRDGEEAKQQSAPVDIRAAVVEHGDEIAQFFKSRTFTTQKENEYRAVLVEFIKFQASHAMKKAA